MALSVASLRRLPLIACKKRPSASSPLSLPCWFRSDAHPEKLYPGTSLEDRFRKVEFGQSEAGKRSFNGVINIKDLEVTYSTSSGPGGQNLHKTRTKVDVRFKVDDSSACSWLPDDVRQELLRQWTSSGQLTKDGYFVVKSDRTRSQLLNQADALMKLRHAIWKALEEETKMTRLETQLEDSVEAERVRKLQVKAARERIRQKRLNSQRISEKSAKDEWRS